MFEIVFFSGRLKQALLAFSALSNCEKILKINNLPKDSILCIHGLRFCSIIWIILVHTYLEVFAIADNKALRIVTERSFMYQTISNATFSVDTFFFIRYDNHFKTTIDIDFDSISVDF